MRAQRPNMIRMEFESRLDVTHLEAIAYLLQEFGPLDGKAMTTVFSREFPDVRLPHANWSTLFSQVVARGLARRVGRGIYAS